MLEVNMFEIFIKLFIIFVPGSLVAWYCYRFGYGRIQARVARQLGASTTCPPKIDAIKSRESVCNFLHQAAREQGVNPNSMLSKIDIEVLGGVIRLLHVVGYKLVIRQVSDEDIEVEQSEQK